MANARTQSTTKFRGFILARYVDDVTGRPVVAIERDGACLAASIDTVAAKEWVRDWHRAQVAA